MKLFLEIYIVFCTLFHTSTASTIELSPRDTWVPRILFPHNGTTWRVDNHHNVTWDLTQQPAEISNPVGIIFLRRDGILFRMFRFSLTCIQVHIFAESYLVRFNYNRNKDWLHALLHHFQATPLATGFQLTDGHAEIQVPDVEPASDYEIIREFKTKLINIFHNPITMFTETTFIIKS